MENANNQAKLLDGKTALITGGTSGIGLATAALFAEQGAQVIVCGRSTEGLAQAEQLPGVTAFPCDVADASDRTRLFEQIQRRWSRLDTIFVSAGVARFRAFEDETPQSFRDSFGANVEGAYFCVQQALPSLVAGASVVFCGSVADQVGTPFTSIYSASKAAVRSLTQTLAVELADRGVRVNCVSPGPTETPIHTKYGLDPERSARLGAMTQGRLLMGRMAQAREIAQVALFLASDQSSFMMGQEVVADGGLSL